MSAAFHAQSVRKSRLTEAIFCLLPQKYPRPVIKVTHNKRHYISRYKLMLNDYQAIRHRAMNIVDFEGEFTLIIVNLRTVQLWFRDETRQEEVSTLVSSQRLPAAPRPSSS